MELFSQSRKPRTPTNTVGKNGSPFDQKYWQKIYGTGEDVDGTFNATEHAIYLKSLCKLAGIEVRSIIDFGFGKAVLLKEILRVFLPGRVIAIDTSEAMIELLVNAKWASAYNLAVVHSEIGAFLKQERKTNFPIDLGICNSVLQYIPDREVKSLLEGISTHVKYLYFSAPTDKDYVRMKKEIGFEDPYAYKRSVSFYRNAIRKYFRFTSFNFLESREVKESSFPDELFQFP